MRRQPNLTLSSLACLIALGIGAPVQAQVAFDASSIVAVGTGDLSWTHTPAGTPRGVVCVISQTGGVTDEVVGVTYGGVAMTETADSPLIHDEADDDGVVYAYFLGATIPTVAQTVIVDANATASPKFAGCVTLTAAADTEVVDTNTVDTTSSTTPSAVLSLSGRTSFAVLIGHSGELQVSDAAPLTDWTSIREEDRGTSLSLFYRYNTIGTTDVTAGWTQTNSDNAAMIAVAVSEVAAAGGNTKRLLLMGVGGW